MSADRATEAARLLWQIGQGNLVRAVFSLCRDPALRRIGAHGVTLCHERAVQFETLCADGKALHENLAPEAAARKAAELFPGQCRQVNLFFTDAAYTLRCSKKGAVTVSREKGTPAAAQSAQHDKEKHRLLAPQAQSFLHVLGLADENGRVYDRARPKYRQICRFLEILDDAYDALPPRGRLRVFDLCCGKSYLSFAVYAYLCGTKQREVTLIGVDRKADVIAYCAEAAQRCGFDGMQFLCGDIETVLPQGQPDLVLSLHACDIATDLLLSCAVQRRAGLILSTPCCQHELFKEAHADALEVLMQQPLLWHKVTDALTDALRCTWLQAQGYSVQTIELVEPEQTPKNVLIRARAVQTDEKTREAHARRYRAACRFFAAAPQHLLPLPAETEETL